MKPPGAEFCPRGGVRREEQGMDQEQRVDRIAANAAPDPEKPKVVKRAIRAAAANAAPAPAPWLKPVASYDRQQRHAYQVMRFG